VPSNPVETTTEPSASTSGEEESEDIKSRLSALVSPSMVSVKSPITINSGRHVTVDREQVKEEFDVVVDKLRERLLKIENRCKPIWTEKPTESLAYTDLVLVTPQQEHL
jgi:hypothetical protein